MKHLIVIRQPYKPLKESWARLSNGVVTCWIPVSLLRETGFTSNCSVYVESVESHLTTQFDMNETKKENCACEMCSFQDDKERFI